MKTQRLLIISSLVACLTLVGCARTFVPPSSDYRSLPVSGLKVIQADTIEEIDSSGYSNVVYLKINNHSTVDSADYQDHLMIAFNKMAFFDKVVTRLPTIYVNASSKADQVQIADKVWHDDADPLTVNQIRQMYPQWHRFLIAEATLREDKLTPHQHPYKKLVFDLKLIDSEEGVTLLYAKNEARAWLGVDRSVVNPVLNAAKEWLERHR